MIKHQIKVSIIVPNYNHFDFLNERLESIMKQSFRDFEVIILDDCSTDNSRNIIDKYKNHPKVKHCIFNDQNSGSPFSQWKKGVKIARGEYIWIAESDDYCDENLLLELVTILDNNGNVGLAYCQSNLVDEGNNFLFNERKLFDDIHPQRWSKSFYTNGLDHINNFMCIHNTIPNASAVVFRKKIFQIEDIPISFRYLGDWYFWIKLLSKSDMYYHAVALNSFRDSTNSTRREMSAYKTIKIIEEKILIKNLISKLNQNKIRFNFSLNRYIYNYVMLISWRKLFFSNLFRYLFFKKFSFVLFVLKRKYIDKILIHSI